MEYLLPVTVATAAFAQSVTGLGFGLVAAPVLVASLGPVEGVAATALLSSVVNAGVMVVERREIAWRAAGTLLAPALVAAPLAALGLHSVSEEAATAAAGVLTLAGVTLLVARPEPARMTPSGLVGAGAMSGAMNAAAGVGGPPAAIFFASSGWSARRVRATLQAYLLGINVVTIAALGVVAVRAELLAALVLGTLAGVAVAGRVPERQARAAMLAVAAAGGLSLIFRAVV